MARFDDRVSILNRSLVSSVSPIVKMENLRVQNLSRNLVLHLTSLPSRKAEVIHKLASKLNLTVMTKLHNMESVVTEIEKQIEIRDPVKMLKLGWAVVRDLNGVPLRTINAVSQGQIVKVSMNKGSLTAVVKEKVND